MYLVSCKYNNCILCLCSCDFVLAKCVLEEVLLDTKKTNLVCSWFQGAISTFSGLSELIHLIFIFGIFLEQDDCYSVNGVKGVQRELHSVLTNVKAELAGAFQRA